MKAKTVNETINFHRNRNPKSILDDNIRIEITKAMKETGWRWWDPYSDFNKEHPKEIQVALNHNLEWAIKIKKYEYIPALIRMGGNLQDTVDKEINFIDGMYPSNSNHCLAKFHWRKNAELIDDMKKYGYEEN